MANAAAPRKRKIILLDFDRTLIDTDRLNRARHAVLRRAGIPMEHIRVAYKEAAKGHPFHPGEFFAHLERLGGARIHPHVRVGYRNVAREKGAYNFSGTEYFLEQLAKRYTLVLFTYAHKSFQREKLKHSGLAPFFARVVFTGTVHKDAEIAAWCTKYKDNVLLVDDQPMAIAAARKAGMKAIRVKKGEKDKAYFGKVLKKIVKIY